MNKNNEDALRASLTFAAAIPLIVVFVIVLERVMLLLVGVLIWVNEHPLAVMGTWVGLIVVLAIISLFEDVEDSTEFREHDDGDEYGCEGSFFYE